MKEKTINFINYLGLSIEYLLKIEDLEIIENRLTDIETKPLLSFQFKMNTSYFETQIIGLSVLVDEKRLVKSIALYSSSIVDIAFLNFFLKKNDQPTHICKLDKLIYKSKTSNTDGFHQSLTKREYSTREVALNETPDFILWQKEDYKIEIRFDYKNNGTQILFGKLTNNF